MRKEILILFIMMTTVVGAGENPFYKPFDGPHGTAPFSRIKIEHFEPAFEKAIAEHKAEIDDIANNIEVATFSNTIEKMEYAGEMLTRVSSVFYNLLGTESNDEMMEISQRMSPKLSMHSNYINLNEKLFSRVKYIFEKRDELALSNEQKRLVEKYYEGFENSGATLSTEGKEKYRELSMELSKATLEFGQNVLRETNAYEMLLTEEDDLAGLPKSLIDAAAAKAKSKEKGGWIFDLTGPSYVGFMQYSSRRDLREKLYMAYNTKNVMGGQFDNREIVQKIVNTRLEIAKLLGYNSYSDYVLKNRMAKSAEGVFGLLDKLAESFTPIAHEEVKAVQEFAGEMEGKPIDIQPWDWSYYSDKLKDSMFGVNDEMTRPYFELERVKQGGFGLATDLYGLQFKKNDDIEVYNSEVEAFDVLDENGKSLSVLYTDFHPRESKRSGAWMSSFKNQFIKDEVDNRPHVTIVMNFTRPTETDPALLTFNEVKTFLHEFGHALHGMLTKTTYQSLSGTNVYRDFVELPSHFMENWLIEKEYLDKFAFHYETGEKMPDDLLQNIIDASNFNVGYATLRQLSFGYLDMAWHSINEPFNTDKVSMPVRTFEKAAMARVQLLPDILETSMSTSFSHIFSGGYAAGYYSYKWSEVMEADAFSLFKENGIFDKATADSFRINILERGNTEEPEVLYKRFRGRDASIDALLNRSGVEL